MSSHRWECCQKFFKNLGVAGHSTFADWPVGKFPKEASEQRRGTKAEPRNARVRLEQSELGT